MSGPSYMYLVKAPTNANFTMTNIWSSNFLDQTVENANQCLKCQSLHSIYYPDFKPL